MRSFFSTILLIALTAQPILKVGTVLYYQLNIDYIVEKYCVNKERPQLKCNGKCYLAKKLQLQQQSETENRNETILITESFIPLYFQENDIDLNFFLFSLGDISHNWKNHTFYFLEVLSKIDPPPRYFTT